MKSIQIHTSNKILLVMMLGVLAACVPTTPRLDAHFGDAVSTARAQQTINPEASLNTDPLQGIDGQAGDAIVDNYRDAFRHPRPPLRGAIDVGTTGASGASGGQ